MSISRLSLPVQWYLLIREMEEFRGRTGWGLASTWGYVHAGDLESARRSFETAKRAWEASE